MSDIPTCYRIEEFNVSEAIDAFATKAACRFRLRNPSNQEVTIADVLIQSMQWQNVYNGNQIVLHGTTRIGSRRCEAHINSANLEGNAELWASPFHTN